MWKPFNVPFANRAVLSLPSMLQVALQVLAEVTGWVLFVSAGGPNPNNKGQIYMEK